MNISVRASLLLGFAALPIVACQAASTPASEGEVVTGVQVGVGKCAFAPSRSTDEKSRVLSAIAGAAISKGVNLLANAVAEAAKAKTWTASGSRNFQATSKEFPQCVQVARGKFYTKPAGLGDWAKAWKFTDSSALGANGLFFAEVPEFFFEGEFNPSADNSALAIRPVFSSYDGPIGTRFLRRGRDRNIALFLAITPPGTKANLESAPAATIVLGEKSPRSRSYYPENGASYRSPVESSWFTLAKADTLKPFTVHALVTETQGADAFLAFVGSVLGDDKVKTAIVTEASQILIPSVGAAAETAEVQAATTVANNADQKLAAALGKLEACAKASPEGLVAAASQAKVALRDYSFADLALSEEERIGLVNSDQIKRIELTKPDTLKQACQAVYDEVTKSDG